MLVMITFRMKVKKTNENQEVDIKKSLDLKQRSANLEWSDAHTFQDIL